MAITVTTPMKLTPEGPYNTGDVVEISGAAKSPVTPATVQPITATSGGLDVTNITDTSMTIKSLETYYQSPRSAPFQSRDGDFTIEADLRMVVGNAGSTAAFGVVNHNGDVLACLCSNANNITHRCTAGGNISDVNNTDASINARVVLSYVAGVSTVEVYQGGGLVNSSTTSSIDLSGELEFYLDVARLSTSVITNYSTAMSLPINYSTELNTAEISTDNPNSIIIGSTAQLGDTVEMFASDDNWVTRTSLGSEVLEEAANGKEWDFGGGALSVVAGVGYTATLDLAMMKAVDSTGIISWVDMLQAHDRWGTKFSVEVQRSNAEAFERGLKGQYTDGVTLTSISGFYPFSSYFNYSGGVAVALSNMPTPKEVNLYGDAVQYSVEAIPAYTDNLYPNVPASGAISRCGNVPADWTLDTGVDLPYPENGFPASLNVDNRAQQTNGGYSSVFHVERTAGEIVKIKVDTDEEGARQLVNLFITNRGENMDSYFPDAYSPFAHIYEGKTYFTTRLASELIELEYANHRHVRVTFSIQCIEAVS